MLLQPHHFPKPAMSSILKMFTRQLSSQSQRLTNVEINKKRSSLFTREKERQAAHITRIEKIEVEYNGPPENCTMIMNKDLSTPFNCAMHIQELFMTRSVVALVNNKPWDMHRPLTEDCQLQFLHFKDNDPFISNKAFWRTGSFLLGYILERAFKDEHFVEICSFPQTNVESGSFVYDADFNIEGWKPSEAELLCMSRTVSQLCHDDLRFERLEVDASIALAMFEDNRFKTAQIPLIAAKSSSGHSVVLYRLHDHVDICQGPLISSTQLLNRFNVTAIHDIVSPDFGPLKRVQGVAIPKQLPIHFYAYNQLCNRASKLNSAPVPTLSRPGKVVAENNLS